MMMKCSTQHSLRTVKTGDILTGEDLVYHTQQHRAWLLEALSSKVLERMSREEMAALAEMIKMVFVLLFAQKLAQSFHLKENRPREIEVLLLF